MSRYSLNVLWEPLTLRESILGNKYCGTGNIKVITFSGREQPRLGLWGYLAEQLGKKELFNEYYSPLQAPGESAWVNLLKDEKILILLDELPPYLDNARATSIGNSDLSKVTITALANLFSALNKQALSNVCLVFSDLKAAYEAGSELLQKSFRELEQEANRVAHEIAPVSQNSDEVYAILKKRLFENSTNCSDDKISINEIATAYKYSLTKTKDQGFTNQDPNTLYRGIVDSYPFHPSIKDLYARFRENQNFQQTRGLIKLMRQIVRELFESKEAEKQLLINVFDINLNSTNLMAQFRNINPALENAISHDIANQGKSVAEEIDLERNDKAEYAGKLTKLLLVSSLSNTNHATLGLTEQEALGFLSAPEIDVGIYKKSWGEIKEKCWYIKPDNLGRLYFQETKNMIAEIEGLVDSYSNEEAKKELRKILEEEFKPKKYSLYHSVLAFPAIDDIKLSQNQITLIISEPCSEKVNDLALTSELQDFYENQSYKNRVMFLSGERNRMERLYDNSKSLKAINSICKNLKDEGVSERDQQFKEAESHRYKAIQSLLSTIRETFITLYYPNKNGITSADFRLEFSYNEFDGEKQIINLLKEQQKFYPNFDDDENFNTMRKKCERRLFTTDEMKWDTILDRAGTECNWQWYHPDQMESLKRHCLTRDIWREVGGYLKKGPFEKETTSVSVSQIDYNEDKSEFILKIISKHGKVHYDIGATPTEASLEINSNDPTFTITSPEVQFICIDPNKEHKTGEVVSFLGKPSLKYQTRKTPQGFSLEFKTHPEYTIRYTTDGSSVKENGAVYNGEFILPKDCRVVSTILFYKDKEIDSKTINIDQTNDTSTTKVIPDKALTYQYNRKESFDDTASTYQNLTQLGLTPSVKLRDVEFTLTQQNDTSSYFEYSLTIPLEPKKLTEVLELIRTSLFQENEINIQFRYKELLFKSGEDFNNWVSLNKLDLNQLEKIGEIKQ